MIWWPFYVSSCEFSSTRCLSYWLTSLIIFCWMFSYSVNSVFYPFNSNCSLHYLNYSFVPTYFCFTWGAELELCSVLVVDSSYFPLALDKWSELWAAAVSIVIYTRCSASCMVVYFISSEVRLLAPSDTYGKGQGLTVLKNCVCRLGSPLRVFNSLAEAEAVNTSLLSGKPKFSIMIYFFSELSCS